MLFSCLISLSRIKKPGGKCMPIVDVTVIPVGTNSPSVSEYVVEIQKVLQQYEGMVKYQLTPMSTLIEGELTILMKIVQELHEVPFKKGLQRVCTNIRIDDRRDKENTMERKLQSVQEKL
jgi:uncharacterized protein (TIGR00106 family)